MKKICILLLAVASSFSVYCQTPLKDGDRCFDKGNYICAETKYKEGYKLAKGEDKQIAEIKLTRAKRCANLLNNANQAFSENNYRVAKENYESILKSNPNDFYAKEQLVKCNNFVNPPATTLSVSQQILSFSSSGGNESISANTNAGSYTINLLPEWCSVQKYEGYFVVKCIANPGSTTRISNFTVTAGDKTARIYINQTGKEVIVNNSESEKNRTAEADRVRLAQIENEKYQQTLTKIRELESIESQKQSLIELKKEKRKLKAYTSIGFQSGEVAKYGLIFETGGKKTIGFHMAVRSSMISDQDILNGMATPNKTDVEIGPNIKISKRFYLNLGAGYGFYNYNNSNDYAGTKSVKKIGYLVTSAGLMIRLSRVINVNAGASFMDIDKDLYKPEIVFGLSFNLKKYKKSY